MWAAVMLMRLGGVTVRVIAVVDSAATYYITRRRTRSHAVLWGSEKINNTSEN